MQLLGVPEVLTPKLIEKIEENTNSKFICITTIKGKYGWLNQPIALFYNKKSHPAGSNWLAVFMNENNQPIYTDGISAVEPSNVLTAFYNTKTDEAWYSAYRHHFNVQYDTFIDGGRDYTRSSIPKSKSIIEVKLQITPNGLVKE